MIYRFSPESEALDNINSLLKQNIKSCTATRMAKKTTIGLISKKTTLHVQHNFFVHFSLCRFFCATTTWNFQKLPSYTFNEGNVVRVLVHYFFVFFVLFCFVLFFFFYCRSISPWWPLAFLIFWSPLQIFHLVLPTKNVSLFYIFRSGSLSLFFSLSFAGLSPAFFLFFCLSLSLYSKFVDMTINLRSLIL